MPEELTSTINENTGESSTPEDGSGDLTPTTGAPSEETLKTKGDDQSKEGEKAEADTKADAEPDGEGESSESVRFDRHPRFKALIETNRELRQNNSDLMGQVGKVLERLEANPTKETSTENVQDLLNMSEEDLFEQLQDKPKAFLQKFAQSLQEGTRDQMLKQFEDFQRIQSAQSEEGMAQSAYDEFGKQNEGFWDMWDSGEIKQFMDKNPAHNAMSAFQSLTGEASIQKQIDDAVKKAVTAREDEINKNIKAKRNVTYLPAGPSEIRSPGDSSPELNDSKQHGGMYSVLTRRLQQRRQKV